MNVHVVTKGNVIETYNNVDVQFDEHLLRIDKRTTTSNTTIRFPLCNVIVFTTSEDPW